MNLSRRPGRLRAVGTTLAALALLLTAACGTDALESGAEPSQTGTPTAPTTPASTTPAATPASDPLVTRGIESGPSPKIAYLADGRLVLPDGEGYALPPRTISFARVGELTVAMTSNAAGDRYTVLVLDAEGQEVRRDAASSYSLAVNRAHDIVAWMAAGGVPRVLDRGGNRIVSMPEVEGGDAVADISGHLDCQEGGNGDPGGCTILVNTTSPQAWVSTSHGFTDIVQPVIRGNAFAMGGILGMVSVTDTGSCSGLWRDMTEPEWQTCDWRFHSVSPDGQTILAGPAYGDGLGDGQLGFLDPAGNVVHPWTAGTERGGIVVGHAWEDAGHALAVIFEDNTWSIVRFGIDGTMEYAVTPRPGEDLDNPFLLETR